MVADGGAKKTYEATAKGRAHLDENGEDVRALMRRIEIMAEGGSGGPPSPAIMHAFHTLRAAVMSRAGMGEKERERIRDIIERAAREIMGGK